MRVVVPFAAEQPKTRLSSVLSPDERRTFARAMLDDVLTVVHEAGHDPVVLATAPFESDSTGNAILRDTPVVVDDRPLSLAVNSVLSETDAPVAVVMSDLPLATRESLQRLIAVDSEIVIAPGRGGGTNALVVRHADFRVDYHGVSYRDHLHVARDVGASVETVDSFRLATDVDEPTDLVEVLLHSDGDTTQWLVDAGFDLDSTGGRVGVRRD
ncbi:2-phospho-L-lactate guanylyltransferase [Halogranum rubrum]|uniref:2-phospho-L-lactate guanylyltransferase n=1 Tax=Halogranum salarium B-1 TaxID=1210908 RepID=J3JER7_9EURY|nr:2-phospho-L-lactate guanylyltransferase [Halogranum salarium]EJN58601.1 hypothetical protein HSB1_30790 [Halogranum salarium B-1]